MKSKTSGHVLSRIAAVIAEANATETQGGDARLWVFKRERQAADMKAAAEGLVTQDQLSWFSGGRARRSKVIGAPY